MINRTIEYEQISDNVLVTEIDGMKIELEFANITNYDNLSNLMELGKKCYYGDIL